jgi:hypothetical protein
MADNKFFYNTNYKGEPERTTPELTSNVTTTISGNVDNIITWDIVFSDTRADGMELYWNIGGASNNDIIGGLTTGNTTIVGNACSVSATLDSENATTSQVNISGMVGAPRHPTQLGPYHVNSPNTLTLEIDGPQVPGVTTADGKANLTVFTANGNLQITSLTAYDEFNRVRALVIGGGGATGHQLNANIANVFNAGVTSVGGGGGGEVINDLLYFNSTANVPVTVGVGGSFDSYSNSDGRSSSIISSLTTLTANGGGGGGCARPMVGNGEGTPNNPNTTISGNVIQQLGFETNKINGRDGGSGGGAACEASDISRFSSWSNNLSSNFKGKPGNATVSASGLGSQGGQGAGHGRAGLGGLNVETFNQVYADGPYTKIAFSSGGIWPPAPTTFTDAGPGLGNFNAGRPLGGGGGGGAGGSGGKGNANAIVNIFNGYGSAKTGGDGGDGVSYTQFNHNGTIVYYAGGGGGGPTFLDELGFDFNSYLSSGILMRGGHINFNAKGPGNNSYLARPGDPGQGGSNANIGGGGSVQFIANKGGKELHEQNGGSGTVIVRSKLKYRVFQT